MAKEFRHYRALADQLGKHVDAETRAALLAGMDHVTGSSGPEVRVCWAREMMQRMDRLLDAETCAKVREGCACVVSNEKSIYARNFRRLRKPISMAWCHCSKGSLLNVYRHVFPGKTCEMEIVHTIATGADDCCFVTTYRKCACAAVRAAAHGVEWAGEK
jgi:hypothetical protein